MQGLLAEVEAAWRQALDDVADSMPGTPAHERAERRAEDLERLLADVRGADRLGVEGEVRGFRATLAAIVADVEAAEPRAR